MNSDRGILVARIRAARAAGRSLSRIATAAGVDRGNLSSFLNMGENFGQASRAKLAAALDTIEAETTLDGLIRAGAGAIADEAFGRPQETVGASTTPDPEPEPEPDPEPPAASAPPPRNPEQVEARFGGVFVEAPGGVLRECVRKDEVVRQEVTNFWARITAETVFDDGAERWTHYEITAQVRRPRGPELTFTVPAAEFAALAWVDSQLGALAVIAAGATNRLVATAVKERSIAAGAVRRREVFAHLGWREVGGRWVYLTGSGALGVEGTVERIEVQPTARLVRYGLAIGDARAAMRASLELLLLAPPRVTVPIWTAIWRAPFGCCESAVWLVGRTGVFKSELAALAQQHYGRGMDARHFPQNWSSTANDIELTLFAAKDALCVVDDFAPGITRGSRQALEDKAERVIRGLGNAAGRGRMTAGGLQRPDRPPRAQALVTAEDLPALHSVRARALIVPVAEGDVDTALLTQAQEAAASGVYEHALADFITWMAGRYQRTHDRWRELASDYRSKLVTDGVHGRSPAALAQLLAAVEVFAEYLDEQGIEVPPEVLAHLGAEAAVGAATLTRRMASVLTGSLDEQARQQAGADPVRLFVETLGEALAGGRAHVQDVGTLTTPARHPELLGFRKRAVVSAGLESETWEARGEHVGWADDEYLYLNPPVAYAAVSRLLAEQGIELPKKPATLWGELYAAGWIALTDRDPERRRNTLKKKISGIAKSTLVLRLPDVVEAREQPND